MAYSDADRLLTVRGTLTYPDTGTQALTSAHISSFLVNEDAGRDVPVGAAPAASFELKLDNSSGQWEPGGSILGAHVLDGAKVEIEIGLWNGAAYDYSDIGTYYVDDVQGQEHETLIRLKGSDAMVSLMSEYYADGAGDYPQTLSSLLTDIAAAAGVTLESSTFTNSTVSIPAQPAWKNNLTCREAVGYIAACAGGIARFNRAGKLEIAPLEKVSSRAVSTSVYKTIQKGDTSFGGLNAINVYAYGAPDGTSPSRYATTPATPDTSLNSINIRDNPILAYGSTALAALGAGMLSALTGLAFRGATFEWHGDPAVELGELCTVTDLSSTAIPILITKQTLRFTSGFSMNSGCAVTTSTKADASGKLQKIFTPTGNLNAEALAGNIYVKAGEKMTLESGGIMNVLSGGEMNIASGGKLTLASGNDVDIGADTLADLLAAATSQTTIWYQDNQPTATATGDIWYDTDASPVTIKRWNGSSWVDITTTALSQALTAAGTAQATADGKIKAWAQTTAPSATAVGDLWIDTDDNNKLYRATAAGTGNWVLYKVAAGYVSTSHITIDNDSIDIVSGGDINVASGGDINVASGGKINLTTANDLVLGGQNITAFTDGRIDAKASTIDLSANNSIKLIVNSIDTNDINILPGGEAVRNTTRYYLLYVRDLFAGKVGRPVTITFEMKCSVARNILFYAYQDSGISIGETKTFSNTSANTWQKFRHTTYVRDYGDKAGLSLGEMAWYDQAGSQSICLRNIKIAFSTSDSGWSEHPTYANLLSGGDSSWGGSTRFVGTCNISPVFDTHGEGIYTISFDIRSAEAGGKVYVYCLRQGTSGTQYNIGNTSIPVSTSKTRKSVTVSAVAADGAIAPYMSTLSFYGANDTVKPVISNIKIEAGEIATPWILYGVDPDPASSVKTSYIDIATDHIDIGSSGNVSIAAGANFNVRAGANKSGIGISNNHSQDYFTWAGSDTPADAPYSVKMDGSLKATNLDGSFILDVANGGTGMTRQNTHRGNSPPTSGLGLDGDLFVLFNGSVSDTWTDTTLGFATGGQATRFGVNRNWNVEQWTGLRRIGNGIGSASYDFGVWVSLSAPAATKTLTFEFATTKTAGGKSLSSGTTSYRVALMNTGGTILATGTCSAAPGTAQTQTVTLSATNNLTKNSTYYVGVFYPDDTEMTGAVISGSITMKGNTAGGAGSALYVKTNGSWIRLAYA